MGLVEKKRVRQIDDNMQMNPWDLESRRTLKKILSETKETILKNDLVKL